MKLKFLLGFLSIFILYSIEADPIKEWCDTFSETFEKDCLQLEIKLKLFPQHADLIYLIFQLNELDSKDKALQSLKDELIELNLSEIIESIFHGHTTQLKLLEKAYEGIKKYVNENKNKNSNIIDQLNDIANRIKTLQADLSTAFETYTHGNDSCMVTKKSFRDSLCNVLVQECETPDEACTKQICAKHLLFMPCPPLKMNHVHTEL